MEFDLAWVGWGKLNLKCQVSNRFFGGGGGGGGGAEVSNSYKRVWTRWKSLKEEIQHYKIFKSESA